MMLTMNARFENSTVKSLLWKKPLLAIMPLSKHGKVMKRATLYSSRCTNTFGGQALANQADTIHKPHFRGSARNFNPVMAKAAKCTIAEVEEIVPVGSLDPDQIHLPGVYVHRLIKGEKYEKRIEKLTVSNDSEDTESSDSPAAKRRERIVRRAAKEFKDGDYANLGIGMPMAASNYVEPGVTLKLQR